MGDTKKVWITKYALTYGMFQRNCRMVPVDGKPGEFYAYGGGLFTTEWAETESDAMVEFEHKRARKLASLRKQIAKLETMSPKFAAEES